MHVCTMYIHEVILVGMKCYDVIFSAISPAFLDIYLLFIAMTFGSWVGSSLDFVEKYSNFWKSVKAQ